MQHCRCTISCQLNDNYYTTVHCFCCCWGKFYKIIPETITIMKTPHTCHFFTVGDVPVQNSSLVTWIIQCIIDTPLRNSILVCSVLWCDCGFCPRSKSYLCCIVFLSNNCSSLTVLQTSYRGHFQSSNMEKSFTIFQGWVLEFPCYSKKSSWGWDQATTVLRSIISPGLD